MCPAPLLARPGCSVARRRRPHGTHTASLPAPLAAAVSVASQSRIEFGVPLPGFAFYTDDSDSANYEEQKTAIEEFMMEVQASLFDYFSMKKGCELAFAPAISCFHSPYLDEARTDELQVKFWSQHLNQVRPPPAAGARLSHIAARASAPLTRRSTSLAHSRPPGADLSTTSTPRGVAGVESHLLFKLYTQGAALLGLGDA